MNNSLEEIDSKTLAAHVFSYRHLGINKALAKNCMKILMIRKSSGDKFDFESYIKEKLEEAPSPSLDSKSQGILKQIFNINLKTK